MKKNLLFALVVLLLVGCTKDDPEIDSQAVKIGSQTWTSVNYKQGDKELFTYSEAQAVTPPEGYRLPTKDDWATLFITLGYTGGWHTSTVLSNSTVTVKETSMENNFNMVKSLMSAVSWEGLTGTNTTGFSAIPLINGDYVNYFVSNPIFGYVEFGSAGFYLTTFDKDIRLYTADYSNDKYAIRFIKN